MKNISLILSGLFLSSTVAFANGNACDQAVPAAVKQHEQKLGKAFDKYRFCGPEHYQDVSRCFTALVKAVIKLESGGNPAKHFKEPGGMKPSQGCMQMSQGECPEGSLTDPNANVKCGVRKMAELIDKGGAICKGNKEGACKYWSVLRPPYAAFGMALGKQRKVIELTKKNLQQEL